ncbi:MAG: hypothetical protein B6I20_05945 [Bacteroidetes bacterium 4572_117]|nr:MAG: hypothetical protein B6I20_05945 [Bacteroidetes bacterium 4572_117]
MLSVEGLSIKNDNPLINLQTLDELLERDSLREKDGFHRRIKLGKFIKPGHGNKAKVVVVPTTTEPKFYHDDSISEEEENDSTGGSGNGEEGEVIGEQQVDPEQGEGQGAGQGQGGEHEIGTEAFDLGKVLTEQFELPNLKDKGKKRSFSKYVYELTDKNRGFGQILDKKASLKKIIQTNILLGKISENTDFNPENLIINPKDQVYRIFSKEKDFESQAIVFFLRDYSGSMQGKPTEAVTTQHLLIYSWLMYQYKSNVISRFILHDTEAKEIPDFHSYFTLQVAGGTQVAPAFELVNTIVEKENLTVNYNIYVFYGTDGDDWDNNGEKMLPALKEMLKYANRIGISISKNSWSKGKDTTVENYLNSSGVLKDKPELIKLDAFNAEDVDEQRLIKGIKILVG